MIADDDQILSELVVLGAGLHWPLSELLDLDHVLRRRLVALVRSEER